MIIIGSGPAGCAAAISCQQNGLSTLIIAGNGIAGKLAIDDIQPSESIHPGVVSLLDKLNAANCVGIASQGKYEGIEVNGQYNPLGEDEHGAWQGHHINRALFDTAFLQAAILQKVEVLEHDTVVEIKSALGRVTGVITKNGCSYTCIYLIDASGYKRMGGKQLKFKEVFHSPPLTTWTGRSCGVPANSQLFSKKRALFIPQPVGWTWLAPEEEGYCTWTRLAVKGKQDFLPPDELRDYPLASKIKASNRRWRVFRPVCKEGVLLCGEAAGILDPASGQGILNAIISGIMAVRTVTSCIKKPAFEPLYLARYDDWYINDYMDKVGRLKEFYSIHRIGIFDR